MKKLSHKQRTLSRQYRERFRNITVNSLFKLPVIFFFNAGFETGREMIFISNNSRNSWSDRNKGIQNHTLPVRILNQAPGQPFFP